MSADLPDTHKAAILFLYRRGGEGVIDQYGRVVAQGQHHRGTGGAQVFLRLFTTRHLEPAGPMRLRLSDKGYDVASALAAKETRWRTQFPELADHHGPYMQDDDEGDFAHEHRR